MRPALIALVVCALPAAAQVRRTTVVAVPVRGATALDAAKAEQEGAVALQSDTRFEWASVSTLARDDGAAREVKALDARRLFDEARERLDNMDLVKALATLDKSIRFYEASDLSAGAGGLIDALALHALVSLAKNDKGGFNNDAQRVLAMNPAYAWDPSRLTPAAQAALAPLKKKLGPATLAIDSTPKGAWVYLDGTFRGLTPLQVNELAAGSHVVTLVAAGHELTQERVFAGPGATSSYVLKPTARGKDVLAALGDVLASAERDVGPSAGALARIVSTDEVVVVAVAPGEVKVARVMADGTVVAAAERKTPELAAAVKEVLAAKAPEPVSAAPEVTSTEPGVVDHSGRRPVGWVLGAVALVSVGAGIGLGLSSKGRAAEANGLPQVDADGYSRLAGQARMQALVADVLFGVAVVAAGVSLFMLITGYSGSGSSGDDGAASIWGFTPGLARAGAL